MAGEKVSLSDIKTAVAFGDTPASHKADEISAEQWSKAYADLSEEKERIQTELDEITRGDRTAKILDDLIEPYANKAYAFMCAYCGFVALFLVFAYSCDIAKEIPEDVMVTLVGSTAVTVIGLVGMVLTGIFVGARRAIQRIE